MGWDQSTGREGVQHFLLRELGINVESLIEKEIEARLAERGLTYEVVEDTSRNLSDFEYGAHCSQVIRLSDGRVFVEARTETQMGDDWGIDFYTFVEEGEPYELTSEVYNGGADDPRISKEIMPGISYTLEELREKGEGMGDDIANMFADSGITHVSFEPGDGDE